MAVSGLIIRNIPEIFQIFQNVQFNTAQHKKYLKELLKLYRKIDDLPFRESFTNALHYLFTFGDKSGNVDRVIEFVAEFCTVVDDCEEFISFVCDVLFECQSVSGQAVRFRSTQLMAAILSALGADAALEDDLCDKISTALRERLQDTRCAVRTKAVEALQRLQNPDDPADPITEAYQFHVHCDPSAAVRKTVINCMAKCTTNLRFVIHRLRDVDDSVRRAAVDFVSSVSITKLKVRERIMILTIGLTERSPRVRRVVDEKLLPSWLGFLNGNILELLKAVRLDNLQGAKDSQFVAGKMLESLFKISLNSSWIPSSEQDFDENGTNLRLSTSELLEWLPLEENTRLVPSDKLGKETAWYWRHLAIHLFQTNDSDTLEMIIPDLIVFIGYIRAIVESPWPDSETDPVSYSTKQYVLHELSEMLQVYDMMDEVGRSALLTLLKDILMNPGVDLLPEVVFSLMTSVRSVLTDVTIRVDFIVAIIQELRDPGEPEPPVQQMVASTPIVEDNSVKIKRAGLRVSLNEALEEQEEAVRAQNYTLAAQCKNRVERLHKQLEDLNVILAYHPVPEPEKDKIETEHELKADPKTLNKCFHLINTLLDTPDIRTITPALSSLYDEFEPLLFQEEVRQNGMKMVALYSMLDATFARDNKTFFFRQLMTVDDQEVMSTALRCLMDILCSHGITIFDEESDIAASGIAKENTTNNSISSNMRKTMSSTKNKSKLSAATGSVLECSDFDVEEISTMSIGAPGTVMGMLLKLLDSDVEEYRLIVVEGICRLLMIGRLVSSSIVSRLILVWFNPANEKEDLLRQTIGVFFSSWTSRSCGTSAAAEQIAGALLPTLKSLGGAPLNSPLANIDVEPILRFIIGLTRMDNAKEDSPDLHGNLGASLVARMIGNGASLEEAPALCRAMALLSPPLCLTLAKQLLASVDDLLMQLLDRNIVDKQSFKNVARYQTTLTTAVTNYSRSGSLAVDQTSTINGRTTQSVSEDAIRTPRATSRMSKRVTVLEPVKEKANEHDNNTIPEDNLEENSSSDDNESTLRSNQRNVTIPETPENSEGSSSGEGNSTIKTTCIEPRITASLAELDSTPRPKHRSTKNPGYTSDEDSDATPQTQKAVRKPNPRNQPEEDTPKMRQRPAKKSESSGSDDDIFPTKLPTSKTVRFASMGDSSDDEIAATLAESNDWLSTMPRDEDDTPQPRRSARKNKRT